MAFGTNEQAFEIGHEIEAARDLHVRVAGFKYDPAAKGYDIVVKINRWTEVFGETVNLTSPDDWQQLKESLRTTKEWEDKRRRGSAVS